MSEYTMEYLRSLDEEQLKSISAEKNRKGNYSRNANKALKVLREREGSLTYQGVSRRAPSYQHQLNSEKGTIGFVKKFK